MSKLNQKGKAQTIQRVAAKRGQTLGVSMNGNVQFKKEPLQHLYELTVSTLVGKDTFYRSGNQLVNAVKQEVREVTAMGQHDFIANLAIHARIEMNVRTIPLVLVVEFAKALRDQNMQYENMRCLVCDVIQRADQITDMYAYALEVFGDKSKVPMAIKRGVGDAFNKFNEYHYGKYNRDGAVKFRDVLRIVHPQAKSVEQGFIFEKIMKDTLETPYTWEVELSKNGQLTAGEQKSKKQLWTELLQSGKLGYMALLRNLRNIVEAGVDSGVMKQYVADVLRDPARVAQSKQFPHAFVLAHRAAQSVNAPQGLLTAIEEALEVSCKNIPQLGDKVALFVDSSGSMQGYCSGYGYGASRGDTPLAPADHASVLSAALAKANSKAWDLRIYYFDSTAKRITVGTNKPVLQIAKELRDKSNGGATLIHTAFDLMKREGYEPDTLIVLSDMEVNQCGYRTAMYDKKNTIKVAVNLNGSDTTPLSEKDGWYQLSGWSDKMFKFIPAMKAGVRVVDALNIPYVGAEAVKASLRTDEETE